MNDDHNVLVVFASALSEKLLDAVLAYYQSTQKQSSTSSVTKVLVSLDAAELSESLHVANKLMSSASSYERVVGCAAAIRRGSDLGLSYLHRELETLRKDEDFFFWVTFSLTNYYRPHGEASIAILRELIELRSGAPGLDAAIAGALKKDGTKRVLPEMFSLLDSSDPSAQRKACWYFHYFTVLAGPDGTINNSGNGRHPFHTEATRVHSGRDKSYTASEHAAYWKSWWGQHREDLGFAETATGN